jgi:hypothetical protein
LYESHDGGLRSELIRPTPATRPILTRVRNSQWLRTLGGLRTLLSHPRPSTEFIHTCSTATRDPASYCHREQRLEFDGGNPQRASVCIALFDPTKREYTLTYSIVGKDGSIRRLDQRTTDELVFVGEKF